MVCQDATSRKGFAATAAMICVMGCFAWRGVAAAQSTITSTLPSAPQQPAARPLGNAGDGIQKLFSHSFVAYTEANLARMQFTDSRGDAVRAALLAQDGEIQLTLKDAIALALENNLDIESVRLLSPMARADLARARSGQLLRNLPGAINPGAVSASGNLQTASPFGYASTGLPAGTLSNLLTQLEGSPIPDTEPVFFAKGLASDNQIPQSNQTVTGTNDLETHEQDFSAGLRKGFFTGTTMTAQIEMLRTNRNAPFDTLEPFITSDLSLRVDQHLLQGFGWQTNRRAIYIARNNGRIADLTFRQQVVATVSQVMDLYYDLVSFREQEKVIEAAVLRGQNDVESMSKRLDMGLISESDLIQAQIELAAEQHLQADGLAQIEEQETTLKMMLTHAGLENAGIAKAHIVPTDTFQPLTGVDMREEWPQKMADLAVLRRSEVQEGEIGLANQHLSLQGARGALRPTLDVYGLAGSNGLAGTSNTLAPRYIQGQIPANLEGGYGLAASQLIHGVYPHYEAGIQLNIPLVNRAARSDLARDQIDLRRQEIAQQNLRNGIRLQAMKAAMAVRQARTLYELSVSSRKLAQHSLDTEQKMYDFGTSDPAHFRAAQSGMDHATIEVSAALNTYARAQVNLQAALDQTIEANDIVLDTARKPVQ